MAEAIARSSRWGWFHLVFGVVALLGGCALIVSRDYVIGAIALVVGAVNLGRWFSLRP